MNTAQLLIHANIARNKAKAPYTSYSVGAVVECQDGSLYYGANIEASCSSCGICAERLALANAAMNGKQPKTIAIIGDAKSPLTPCGTCRQFMIDFTPLKVILANTKGNTKFTTANKLLPLKFERRKKQ
jgi:cytidine deaminase